MCKLDRAYQRLWSVDGGYKGLGCKRRRGMIEKGEKKVLNRRDTEMDDVAEELVRGREIGGGEGKRRLKR